MNDRYFGTLLAADQEWEGVGHVIEGIHTPSLPTFFYDDISRILNALRKCRQEVCHRRFAQLCHRGVACHKQWTPYLWHMSPYVTLFNSLTVKGQLRRFFLECSDIDGFEWY